MIPRQRQGNLPSFPSLTSRVSTWWAWGTVVTPRPGRTGVEAAVGARGCPPPPAPSPRLPAPGPAAPRPPLHVFAASAAGACGQHATRFVPQSPRAQLHFPRSPPQPSPLPRACRPCLRFCFFAFSLRISVSVCFVTLIRQSKGRTWKANLKAERLSPAPSPAALVSLAPSLHFL